MCGRWRYEAVALELLVVPLRGSGDNSVFRRGCVSAKNGLRSFRYGFVQLMRQVERMSETMAASLFYSQIVDGLPLVR